MASEAEPDKAGRPTLYRPEYAEQAYKLCLLGATNDDIADFFGVCRKTANTWIADQARFGDAVRRGRMVADAEIAESLYQRAKGYSHPDVHVSSFQGDVTLTPITKHYPPDTGAASLWLRNRQPKMWRDKLALVGGEDGDAPIVVKVVKFAGDPSSE